MSSVFFCLSAEERREIICTEDRKDHEEETAGTAWSHLFRNVAAQVDRTAFKESDSL
jgi:hypothetical protein